MQPASPGKAALVGPPLAASLLHVVAGGVTWSLLAAVVPLVAALWSVPRLVHGLGADRFGFLALVWAILAYAALLDLGLGRGLTKWAAERAGDDRAGEIASPAAGTLRTLHAAGLFAGLLVALGAPWLVPGVLAVPAPLVPEAVASLRLVGTSLPLLLSTNALIGLLQARRRFRTVALIQAGAGTASFAGPAIAAGWSSSLVVVTGVLVVLRAAAWLGYRLACRDLLPRESPGRRRFPVPRELFRFGFWVTVTNVISTVVVYVDRFVLAALLGLSAVAYYAAPYEMVTRLWVVADAFVAVAFPVLAATLAGDPRQGRAVFVALTRMVVLTMLVPIGLLLLFADEILARWLGGEFAREGSGVLRWLAAGVFVNSAARLPLAALHAAGLPDVVARLHLIELPLYLALLWVLARLFGIDGAAAAWTLRATADCIALFLLAARFLPELAGVPGALRLVICAPLLLAVLPVLPSLQNWTRIATASCLVAAAGFLAWRELRAIVAGARLQAGG